MSRIVLVVEKIHGMGRKNRWEEHIVLVVWRMTREGMDYSIRYWLEVQFPREVVMVMDRKSARVVWDRI